MESTAGSVGQYGEHSRLSEGGGDSDTTAIVKYSMNMALRGNAVPMVRFSPEPGFWVSFNADEMSPISF
jgi:hypothetical protein